MSAFAAEVTTSSGPSSSAPSVGSANSSSRVVVRGLSVAASNNNTMSSIDTETVTSDVCRDFLRNVCTRGAKCKYYHPKNPSGSDFKSPGRGQVGFIGCDGSPSPNGSGEGNLENGPKKPQPGSIDIVFCHDHSNAEGSGCARPHCRYVHASAEEEREYRQSGYLPPHVRDQTIRKGIAVDLPTLYGRKPICKENLKGECKRSNCRFRHLTPMQYDIEMSDYFQREYFQREQQQRMMYNGGGGAPAADYPEYEYERRQQIRPTVVTMSGGPMEKRRRQEQQQQQQTVMQPRPLFAEMERVHAHPLNSHHHLHHQQPQQQLFQGMTMAEREDKIEMLTRENAMLKTTIECLLEQNAQLRTNMKNTATSVVSAVAAQPAQISALQPQPHSQGPPGAVAVVSLASLAQPDPILSTSTTLIQPNITSMTSMAPPVQPTMQTISAPAPVIAVPAAITVQGVQPAAIEVTPAPAPQPGGPGQPQPGQPPPGHPGAEPQPSMTVQPMAAQAGPPPGPPPPQAAGPPGPSGGPPPGPPPPPPQSRVHVQEARLVSYPIPTSMRQQM